MLTAYLLTRKYVNQERDIPPQAQNILYYSLAVGHHVGVIDCLEPLAKIDDLQFSAWLEELPDSAGKQRLQGVLRWGEIELNAQTAGEVLPLLEQAPEPFGGLVKAALRSMASEPAVYLMLRRA